MIKQKQLNRHVPAEDIIGDCYRTTIACLLDKHPSEVPHFGELCWDFEKKEFREGSDMDAEAEKYLQTIGYTLVRVAWVFDSVQEMLECQEKLNPGVRYILAGRSRNEVNHVVIASDGEIEWDPSQNDSGIIGPCSDGFYWATYILPSFMRKVA
ncbi:MAG TPA: hypothetical protein VN039_13360 [Nitrospira sp.]|nr:hypothetical protein [Nitrospira sp.]